MRVASMFSGIGGIDLAFENLGHEIVWANDIDKYANDTYKKNFPDTLLIEDNICNINEKMLPDFDLLIAGFPCQSFSIMGYQRGFKDPRGNLFFEIERIVKEKQPQIIFLENVKNLVKHDGGKTFTVIYTILSELNYYIKYKIMSPHKYTNIPQLRERIFIVAFKDLTRCENFRFPELVCLTKTINDFIDRSEIHHNVYYYNEENIYFDTLNKRIRDKEAIYRIDDWGVANRKWEICPTLKANMGTYSDRVSVIRDDFGIRKLTPYECLKLQGFSDGFKFANIPINEAYKQCGNTVCVKIVEKILKPL